MIINKNAIPIQTKYELKWIIYMNMREEIKYQLEQLHYERIDKDDFIRAIEEIYWNYEDK